MSENLPESMCCPCDHYGRSVMCRCTCHAAPPTPTTLHPSGDHRLNRSISEAIRDQMARYWHFDGRDLVAGVAPTVPACKTCGSEALLPHDDSTMVRTGICWPCAAWRMAFKSLCSIKTCFEVDTVGLVHYQSGTRAPACRRHAGLAVKSGEWKKET